MKMNRRKHDWEPVDNQGHSMECNRCGTYVGIYGSEWEEQMDAPCPEAFKPEEKKCLPEEDVAHFRKYCKHFEAKDWYWGFTCFSRQSYWNVMEREFVDEIIYGVYSYQGGCMAELRMAWKKLDDVVPYLRSFSESFPLITSPMHRKIFQGIYRLDNKRFSPDDFSRLLISLGFQDDSNYLLDDRKDSGNMEQPDKKI